MSTAQLTCDDGNFAKQALRDAPHQHDAFEAKLHILYQLLVLLVLGLMIYQGTAFALSAIGNLPLEPNKFLCNRKGVSTWQPQLLCNSITPSYCKAVGSCAGLFHRHCNLSGFCIW